jgi:hypothetical protein
MDFVVALKDYLKSKNIELISSLSDWGQIIE